MTPARRLGDLLAVARQALATQTDTPSLDAELLMMTTLGVPRAWVLAHPEAELRPEQEAAFQQSVERCVSGEALPYVIGWWEFFGRQFHLSPEVLIPRPETEILVQTALRWLAARPDRRRVSDVGTGSGCIVVTLAAEMDDRSYSASDDHRGALAIAQKNAGEYGVLDRIAFVQCDLLSALRGPFDLVCANLPYIPTARLAQLGVARREPRRALDGGQDGLEVIRRLLVDAERWLAPGGRLLIELDPDQVEAASRTARQRLDGARIEALADLSGADRLLVIDRPG